MDPSELGALTPLTGGWSGETFRAETGGAPLVVRIYARPGQRGEAAAEVDAALLRLVRGLVPVPDVVEVRRPDTAAGTPGLLVTSWVDGVRGDELLPTLDDSGLITLGTHLGELAADLGGMPMLSAGPFLDADLRVGDLGGADLTEYVAGLAPAFEHWSDDERAGLADVAAEAQDTLDRSGRFCLVHSDLNPKNLLLDPASLSVAALVDWEFAHAGHPFTDLGNLLRFDRHPAYVEAVLAAYCRRRGGEPGDVLGQARAADLWALVDLASRAGQNPVADRADALLRVIAARRDPHAVPA
ncbi:MAG: phosphotransferase family protein [Nocardioides sp.]